MTTYAAGLRVSEVVRLQLTDIESDRMLIRVEQGKGRKDRYTLLSTRLLTELRAYWKLYRPAPWLFTGLDPHRPRPGHRAENLLSRQADRGDHTRPRYPYAAPLFRDAPEGPTSGRSRCCWAISHSIPPHGTSGSPGSISRRSAARSTSCPAGTCPSPRRSNPMVPHATDCPERQRWASPVPHRGKSPLSSASMGRRTAVPIPCRPRIRR